jgi:alkylation response protein AidB-like acyl-CoA dehydrogenase
MDGASVAALASRCFRFTAVNRRIGLVAAAVRWRLFTFEWFLWPVRVMSNLASTAIDGPASGPAFEQLLGELADLAPALEADDGWPGHQFVRLAETGVLGWVIPREYGGADVSQAGLMHGYLRLSAACLVTAFVLTQRNGACQRIATSDNEQLKAELLPALAAGDLFATVGISHLTTSRQHWKKPTVAATASPDGFTLEGNVPWVTGARFAQSIVTGGTCADGRQVLVALPTDLAGVSVLEPPRLMALNASQTGSVRLEHVQVPERFVLAGPVENVMKRGAGGGAGSLTTSALALGHAENALVRLRGEAEQRPDLQEIHEPLAAEQRGIAGDLLAMARGEAPAAVSIESIRQRANSLVLRAAQAYLAASKGAGYVAGHPAERIVREAMFFLVWSCPQPVASAAMREFACLAE